MMMLKRSAIIFSLLLLAACAHVPRQEQNDAEDQDVISDPHEMVQEDDANLPHVELDPNLLYQFLIGEVAAQRGESEVAIRAYLDIANSTKDPRAAQRAAQLAFQARQYGRAAEALQLWLELEPDSNQAEEQLITALLASGDLEKARPYLEDILAKYPGKAGHTFLQTFSLLEKYPDKEGIYNLLLEITKPYPKVAEGHLMLGQAAAAINNLKVAKEEIHRARVLNPDSVMAVVIEAELYRREDATLALDSLAKFLKAHPDAGQVRLMYARVLLEQHKYEDSRKEFQKILDAHPGNADMAFTVAMLSLQLGDLDKAEAEFKQILDMGGKDENSVYYYLGQLEEARKDSDKALNYYRQVNGGEYDYAAHVRVVYLLYKSGKTEEAQDYLKTIDAQNNEQRVQKMLLGSQLLRDTGKPEEAYEMLNQGLKQLPDHPELLYETAMLAEQLGKHDVFETMMRKVIEIKSDSAQAYNALGYSMLDRNEHLQEGMELVEKANELEPNDAAIMDSVGWGHYRLGNYAKSLEYLRRAYDVIPDPEIAAHLGEVLWMQGDKEQARKVWGNAIKSHADNKLLQSVMKKFQP